MNLNGDRQRLLNLAGGLVAFTVMANLSFLAWSLVFREIPKANELVLVQFIGNLTGFAGLIVGFYFGSSSTNKKQADTIEKQAATIQEARSALAPLADSKPTVSLAAGETATVKATDP